MKKRVALAALTTAGFSAGLGIGLWIGLNRLPTPPPPAWVFTEFKNVTRAGPSLASLVQARPDLWREINTELQSLRPQMDDFRVEIEKIDGDFRRDLEAILTETQKRRLDDAQKRRELPRLASKETKPVANTAAGSPSAAAAQAGGSVPAGASQTAAPGVAGPAAAAPAGPAAPPVAKPEPLPKIFYEANDWRVASMVFIPYTHERFTQVLGLDENQQARLRDLLLARRTRFLALADEMAPPSLQLSRIADLIRKVEAETKKK